MDLDAQVRERLRQHFAETNAACHSHAQFDRLVKAVVAIVEDAEAGRLLADRGRTPPPEPESVPPVESSPADTPLTVEDSDGQPCVV